MSTDDAYVRLVEPYRAELHAHCYRMLGSLHDAEDALQEALLGAWRGLPRFEGRSSLRAWLYTICTNACLRLIERRRKRVLELGPAGDPRAELGEPLDERVWVEPYPDEQLAYEQRESVELAFVAALQHLPGTQRAVLILREVLGFSAREVAEALDTSVPSVNSALQRARTAIDRDLPSRSQQETLRELGDERVRELVSEFVAALERGDVDAIRALLAEDATFSMPPLAAWFRGRDDIAVFFGERIFTRPWRVLPAGANGQPAVACYQGGEFGLTGLNVLTLRGDRIAGITAFLSPAVLGRFDLPAVLI